MLIGLGWSLKAVVVTESLVATKIMLERWV